MGDLVPDAVWIVTSDSKGEVTGIKADAPTFAVANITAPMVLTSEATIGAQGPRGGPGPEGPRGPAGPAGPEGPGWGGGPVSAYATFEAGLEVQNVPAYYDPPTVALGGVPAVYHGAIQIYNPVGDSGSPSISIYKLSSDHSTTVCVVQIGVDANGVQLSTGSTRVNIIDTNGKLKWSALSGIPSNFTPSTHASSHGSGGSDAIPMDSLAMPTDITTLNASTSTHGLLRKLDGNAAHFRAGDGPWSAPAGGGDMLKSVYDTNGDNIVDKAAALSTAGATKQFWQNSNLWAQVDFSDLTGVPSTFAPSAHAVNHKSGGSDLIKLDELAAPTDIVTLNASVTAHGLLVKTSGTATDFLGGDNAFHAHSTIALDTLGATTDITTRNASATAHGLLVKVSGTATDFVGGDNACHAHSTVALETLVATTDITTRNASTTAHGLLVKVSGTATDFVGGDNACHAHSTVPLDTLGAGTDITTLNASVTAHGLMPKGINDVTKFYRSDLTQAVPPSATATVAGYVPTPPNDTNKFFRGDATFTNIGATSVTTASFTCPAFFAAVSGVTIASSPWVNPGDVFYVVGCGKMLVTAVASGISINLWDLGASRNASSRTIAARTHMILIEDEEAFFYHVKEDFTYAATFAYSHFCTATGTGAGNGNLDAATNSVDHPGIAYVTSGTVSTNSSWLYNYDGTLLQNSGGIAVRFVCKISGVPSSANAASFWVGLAGNPSGSILPTDFVGWRLNFGTDATHWTLSSIKASTATNTAGYAATTNWSVL